MSLSSHEKLRIMEEHLRVSWSDLDEILDANVEEQGGGAASTRDTLGLLWAENKYPIFKMFGDKLVLTSKVENAITYSEIESSLDVFLKEITQNKEVPISDKINIVEYFGSFGYTELNNNILLEDKTILNKKMNKGMKVSRGLKQVISDKKVLTDTQTAYSKFVQEMDASGTLEISIDPIDILMSSVNSDGRWRSCHNVFNGEYASGAVAYTVDASTVVAQIYNKRDSDNIALKTWRQLLYLDSNKDLAIFARQYPSSNKNNSRAVIDLIKKEVFSGVRHGFFNSGRVENHISDKGGCHYNDITNSHMGIVRAMTLSDKYSHLHGSEKDSDEKTMRPILEDSSSRDAISFKVGIDKVPSVDVGQEKPLGQDEEYIYSAAMYY